MQLVVSKGGILRSLTDLALNTVMRLGASYADIRIIRTQYEFVSAKNEKVSNIGRSEDEGFGVRVIADGAWGYASSGLMTKREIERRKGNNEPDRSVQPPKFDDVAEGRMLKI